MFEPFGTLLMKTVASKMFTRELSYRTPSTPLMIAVAMSDTRTSGTFAPSRQKTSVTLFVPWEP